MTTSLTYRKRAVVAAAGGLMLLLGLCGAMFSFLSSFPVLVNTSVLMRSCLVAGLCALAVFSLPKLWMRLSLSCLWLGWVGWMVWENFSSLTMAALAAAEQVGAVFAKKIGMGLVAPDFSAQIGNLSLVGEREVCTLLCTLVIALLALWLGFAVVRRRSFWLGLLGTAPFLIAPLTITVTPEWTPLMALVLFYAVGLLTRLAAKKDPWGGAKMTFLALPVTALLLFLLGVVLPREDYQQAEWVDHARLTVLEQVTMAGSRFLTSGPVSGLAGGSVEVDLSDAGPLRFTGGTVLRVESEITGHIYLRGFSAGVYGEKGWEQLSDDVYDEMRDGWDWVPVRGALYGGSLSFTSYKAPAQDRDVSLTSSDSLAYHQPGIGDAQPLNFPALVDQAANPAASARGFTIESVGVATGYVFTPYQLATTPDRMTGAEFKNDAYLARGNGIRRFVLYARTGASPLSAVPPQLSSMAAEQIYYRAFVEENYLQIPEELLPVLTDLLGQGDFEPMYSLSDGDIRYGHQELDRVETAGAVADLLHSFTQYDPETPVTPDGEDFVAYFLTQSHRGYCMHYASAATLMLRYLGIPARYTTGYTADVVAGQTVNVPDKNAHAWVEIYIDGYGWHPVEVTPGFDRTFPWTGNNTNTPAPTPSRTPAPLNTPRPTPSHTPDGGGGEDGERAIDWSRLFDPMWLIPPAVLALLGWLLRLRRDIAANGRRKRFYSADTNRAVIDMYVYAQRLLRCHKNEEMEALPEALGQKAKFSTHKLSEDERLQMLGYTTGLAVRTYYLLGWWHKLFLRYVMGLC